VTLRLAETKALQKSVGARLCLPRPGRGRPFGGSRAGGRASNTLINDKAELGLNRSWGSEQGTRAYSQAEIANGVAIEAALILKDLPCSAA